MCKSKKNIAISAVNQVDGGTLKIVEDFLGYIDEKVENSDNIYIALVHSDIKRRLECKYKNVIFKGFKYPKKSWLFRLFFENLYCYFFSKKHQISHWISLHDLTPRLPTNIQSCVYCHNPSPFHKLKWIDFLNFKFVLFVLFYKYAYSINIKRNKFVIVQQDWLKEYFNKQYELENVHVVPPNGDPNQNYLNEEIISVSGSSGIYVKELTFIYPSLPRTYKNIEMLIKAFKALGAQNTAYTSCKLILTIEKNENLYSRYLAFLAGKTDNISFVGRLPHSKIIDYLSAGAVLIFPSRLETWGLPLSEARSVNADILAADLEYAHETLAGYSKVKFFDVDDVEALVKLIYSESKNGAKVSNSLKSEKFPEKECKASPRLRWQEYILDELLS